MGRYRHNVGCFKGKISETRNGYREKLDGNFCYCDTDLCNGAIGAESDQSSSESHQPSSRATVLRHQLSSLMATGVLIHATSLLIKKAFAIFSY